MSDKEFIKNVCNKVAKGELKKQNMILVIEIIVRIVWIILIGVGLIKIFFWL